MEYQEYETTEKIGGTISSFEGQMMNAKEETSRNMIGASGVPSSAPYPIPDTVFNSMENSNMDNSNESENKNLPLVAKPPPHVMTSLGPMPLPVEVRRKIPEKFVAKPIIEEREIYVAKKEVQERTVEIPHIQYEHKFSKIPKMINIKKLVPSLKEIVQEVPKEVFKPVIEEKVIEVPQGVKYVEVPVEVPCFYPPKIVPKPKEQIVERIVETIKPVVKEKIIEVPQTVVKNVPRIKTVEVPYFVPKYVEKIIEVPYQPGEPNAMLPPLSSGMPPNIQGIFQGQGPISFGQENFMQSVSGDFPEFKREKDFDGKINIPFEAKIEANIIQPTRSPQEQEGFGQFKQPHFNTSIPIELPTGMQWGAPPNAPHPSQNCNQFLEYPSSLKMPPMMITFPPEIRNITYCGKVSDPDILTRSGVMPFKGFKKTGTAQILFPPLPYHAQVPMKDNGMPDVETMNELSSKIEMSDVLRRRTDQSEEYYQDYFDQQSACYKSSCCSP